MSSDKLITRQEVFNKMSFTRYDYGNERQSFKAAMTIIAILYVFLISWLYLNYASLHPAILIGFCYPLASFGARWLRFSKRWQGSITLTVEGLLIEKDGNRELMPWDSIKEIKNIRFGFSVRIDLAKITIWDGISPPNVSWKSLRELFGLGEMSSRKLIDNIKAMNPSIVHIEPFLSRDLQTPRFERIVATLMILALILFVIVMIFTRQGSAGRQHNVKSDADLTIRLERVAKTAPLSRAVLPSLREGGMRQLSRTRDQCPNQIGTSVRKGSELMSELNGIRRSAFVYIATPQNL